MSHLFQKNVYTLVTIWQNGNLYLVPVLILGKGAFTNYIYKIWLFLTTYSLRLHFYGIKVYKKLIFLTTYPPPLVNVVCERPPVFDIKKLTLPVLTQLELDTKCHFGSDQLQFQGMKSFFIDQVSLKHTS